MPFCVPIGCLYQICLPKFWRVYQKFECGYCGWFFVLYMHNVHTIKISYAPSRITMASHLICLTMLILLRASYPASPKTARNCVPLSFLDCGMALCLTGQQYLLRCHWERSILLRQLTTCSESSISKRIKTNVPPPSFRSAGVGLYQGRLAEWPNALDSKSGIPITGIGGLNPSSSA